MPKKPEKKKIWTWKSVPLMQAARSVCCGRKIHSAVVKYISVNRLIDKPEIEEVWLGKTSCVEVSWISEQIEKTPFIHFSIDGSSDIIKPYLIKFKKSQVGGTAMFQVELF